MKEVREIVRRYFRIADINDNPFRIINIGIAIFFVLIVGYITDNYKISSFASLGLFTFYYYQNLSMNKLIKRMGIIGIFLYISLLFGILSTYIPWTSPLIVAIIAFFSRIIFRLINNQRPGPIFFAMISAMGASMKIPIKIIPEYSIYFLIGVGISIIITIITKKMDKREEVERDKIPLLIKFDRDPLSLIDAFFFSASLFLTVYLSHALKFHNPYWMTISCASVLLADNLDALRHRHIQQLLGSMIGLLIASFLISMNLSIKFVIVLIVFLYTISQYYTVRNYAMAYIFLNPMVILLSSLIRNKFDNSIIGDRLIGILCGGFLGLFIAGIMIYSLTKYHKILENNEN